MRNDEQFDTEAPPDLNLHKILMLVLTEYGYWKNDFSGLTGGYQAHQESGMEPPPGMLWLVPFSTRLTRGGRFFRSERLRPSPLFSFSVLLSVLHKLGGSLA